MAFSYPEHHQLLSLIYYLTNVHGYYSNINDVLPGTKLYCRRDFRMEIKPQPLGDNF